jgi:hypothetical protein
MEMDDREYSQLDSLASSNNRNQTDLMDKINNLEKEQDAGEPEDGDTD